MRLHRLLDPGLTIQGAGWREVEITALAADSRAVRAGTLFAALPGSKADGRSFIDDAVARGAAAVLSDPSLRRDYDIVRQQVLYRPPPASPLPPVTQRTGAFRAGGGRVGCAVHRGGSRCCARLV